MKFRFTLKSLLKQDGGCDFKEEYSSSHRNDVFKYLKCLMCKENGKVTNFTDYDKINIARILFGNTKLIA